MVDPLDGYATMSGSYTYTCLGCLLGVNFLDSCDVPTAVAANRTISRHVEQIETLLSKGLVCKEA